MTISEKLFSTLSGLVGVRLTKDNFRSKLKTLQTSGIYNQKMKSEMLIEMLFAISELDEKKK